MHYEPVYGELDVTDAAVEIAEAVVMTAVAVGELVALGELEYALQEEEVELEPELTAAAAAEFAAAVG